MLNELMTNGFSVIIPATFVAFTAQAGVVLAAGLRSRQPGFRKLAFWATGTALLGVPEPAIYAVNMRRMASFGAALIGGAIGGLYLGIVFVKSFALSEFSKPAGNPVIHGRWHAELAAYLHWSTLGLRRVRCTHILASG